MQDMKFAMARFAFAIACALCLFALATPASAQMMGCTRYFPEGTRAVVFSTDSGADISPIRLKSGHFRATREVTINIAKYDTPVLVVLHTYYSMLWRIEIDPATQVVGVLVFGEYAQGVANVPQDIPVGFSTAENGRQSGCPDHVGQRSDLDDFVRRDLNLILINHHTTHKPRCMPGPCRSASSGGGLWSMLFGGDRPSEHPIRTSYGETIDPDG